MNPVNKIIGTSFESKEAALAAYEKRYSLRFYMNRGLLTEVESIECDQCGGWFILPDEKLHPELRRIHIDNQSIRFRREELYHSAFDDEPEQVTRYFCSDECNTKFYDCSDEQYFTCEDCYRTIATMAGRNNQYRVVDDSSMVCLRCYEQDILENGIPREKFEEKRISGMFFSGDNNEPLAAGYEINPKFSNAFIQSQDSIDRYCATALKFIDRGYRVVTGYERLSIVGDEGYVTMFVKREKEA